MDENKIKNSNGANIEKISLQEIKDSKDDELVDIVMQKILQIK